MRRSVRAIVIHDDCLLVIRRDKYGQHFFSLPGGGIDPGETSIEALHRELQEETSITIGNQRLVAVANFGPQYGRQQIYLADYKAGRPSLDSASGEAAATAQGANCYWPEWLPLDQLEATNLLPTSLKQLILASHHQNWPATPITLTI